MSPAKITVEYAFRHTQVLYSYTAIREGLRAISSLVAAYFAALCRSTYKLSELPLRQLGIVAISTTFKRVFIIKLAKYLLLFLALLVLYSASP